MSFLVAAENVLKMLADNPDMDTEYTRRFMALAIVHKYLFNLANAPVISIKHQREIAEQAGDVLQSVRKIVGPHDDTYLQQVLQTDFERDLSKMIANKSRNK